MKRILMILVSSILAGFAITFGATVYLMCLNLGNNEFYAKAIGAFMFCIGLFTIIHFDLWLYTGKVGYVFDNKPIYLLELLVSFIGNVLGSLGLASLIKLSNIGSKLTETASNVVSAKLDSSWYSILIMSIMCGVMIYIAVEGHKRCKYSIGKFLFAFMPIMLFILVGFEHVIANVTYFTYAGTFSWKVIFYFFLMFIGNAIGSIVFDGLLRVVKLLMPKQENNIEK